MEPGPSAGDPTRSTSGSPTGAPTGAESPAPHPDESEVPAGSRIGPFRIVRLIGVGGMGAVYEAEQDKPRRPVALKLIRPGLASERYLRRFELEAEALGRLQHPGIAQIFQASTVPAPGGPRPFFAMELVRGVPLTDYADQHKLGTRERLRLIARIAEAVQHAHSKGVIHRDLKPGNILVDESGQPKVLDFGVARLTDHDVQQVTVRTDIGQLIGTVPYMSPEQVTGDPQELDTRSDVYALGVIAYELLAGRLPYDLRRKMIHEAVRVIREDEPARLSTINRSLRGDIETIVAKALEKERGRRYQTALALAADIDRYLRDEPIAARPAGTAYQLRKFAKRHKALVGGIAAAMLLLAGGVLGTSLALARALRAETGLTAQLAETEAARRAESDQRAVAETERAEAQAQRLSAQSSQKRAEAISSFVVGALQSSDPAAGGHQDATIAQAMAGAIARIDEGAFRDEPETEAALRNTIATILMNNGNPGEALPLYQSALDTRRRLFPGDHRDVAESLSNLSSCLEAVGRPAEALPLVVAAQEMHQRLFPGDSGDGATMLNNVAMTLLNLGRSEEALLKYQAALAMTRRLFPGDHADVANSLNNAAVCLDRLGRSEEALAMYRECLAMTRRLFPGDRPAVANALNNLATCLHDLGRPDEALPLVEEALEMNRRMFGGDHPDVALALSNVASTLDTLGRYEEALVRATAALDMRRRLFPGDHPAVAESLNAIAFCLEDLGRAQEALPLYESALHMYEKLYEGDHPSVSNSLNNLAACLDLVGRSAEALPMHEAALRMNRRMIEGDHPVVAVSLTNLARCQAALGALPEAERSARDSVTMFEHLFPDGHPRRAIAMSTLALVLHKQGSDEEAAALIRQAEEMVLRFESPGATKVTRVLSDKKVILGE